MGKHQSMVVLVADDDEDDQILIKEGLLEAQGIDRIDFVSDGTELMEYLEHSNGASCPNPRPDLILLDLNMPRMDGREALQQIKCNAAYRSIPIVVLTTSYEEEEVLRCYQLGANSFITKPVSFERLAEILKTTIDYWTKTATLPPTDTLTRSLPAKDRDKREQTLTTSPL